MITTKLKTHANDEAETYSWKILEEYSPNIGAPFKITLCDAVRQRVSVAGEVLETEIPNLGGLLKEAAVARALCTRKLSPADIKFFRKALNLKGTELAKVLAISPEHLSRCENEGRTLSPSADKLLRVIVLKKRYNFSMLEDWIRSHADKKKINETDFIALKKVTDEYRDAFSQVEKAIFEGNVDAVYDHNEILEFSFYLEGHHVSPLVGDNSHDDERWKRAA